MKIHICRECSQVVLNVGEKSNPVHCCNTQMNEFAYENYSIEKNDIHYPTIREIGNFLTITFKEHPMIEVHKLDFVLIETNFGFLYKEFEDSKEAEVEFILALDEKIINVFANCNVHSLLKVYPTYEKVIEKNS